MPPGDLAAVVVRRDSGAAHVQLGWHGAVINFQRQTACNISLDHRKCRAYHVSLLVKITCLQLTLPSEAKQLNTYTRSVAIHLALYPNRVPSHS
jgi:hypothetical protein